MTSEQEIKKLNEKLKSLNARKAKLSGSKHKRERQKVRKQINQTQKRLVAITKEDEANVVKQVEKKKNAEEVAKERQLMREEQRAIVAKHAETVENTTVEDLRLRIEILQAGLEDCCTPSFWEQKTAEHDENVRTEKQKQKQFLVANKITPADVKKLMEEFKAKGETFEQLRKKRAQAALDAEQKELEEKSKNKEETVDKTTEEEVSKKEIAEEVVQKNVEEVVQKIAEEEEEEAENIVLEKTENIENNMEENVENNTEENKEDAPVEVKNEEPEKPERPLQQGDSVIVETEEGTFPGTIQRFIKKTKKWRVLKEDGTVLKVAVESISLAPEDPQPFPGYKDDKKPVADVKPKEETTKEKIDKNYGSAAYWDDRYENFDGKTEEWYEGWESLKTVLEQNLSKTDIIVDFGCGDSFLQDQLKNEGYTVWGSDISNAVLERLSEKSEREMFSADGFCFPLKTDSIDVIIDKGTLDAINCDEERDLAPLFAEIERVLTPGGKYICLTPWHAEKRMPQFKSTEWAEIKHEVIPLTLKTLAKQRYNQLKGIPKFAKDLSRLGQMAMKQAQMELAGLDHEAAKHKHPQKNCVLQCYVCIKDIQFLS